MSHTLLILKIYTTFKDVQMMLKIFFDISTGFKFSKISVECSVHSCSCPCSKVEHFTCFVIPCQTGLMVEVDSKVLHPPIFSLGLLNAYKVQTDLFQFVVLNEKRCYLLYLIYTVYVITPFPFSSETVGPHCVCERETCSTSCS